MKEKNVPSKSLDKFTKKLTELKENRQKLEELLAEKDCPTNYLEICQKSAVELNRAIKSGELTVHQVLTSYQKLSKDKESSNFVSNYLIEADADAEEITTYSESNSLLYGIPVSIKDCFEVKGYDSSLGLVKTSLNPKKESSGIYFILKAIGAIPFMTTAMAQGGFSIDSSTRLFGEQSSVFGTNLIGGGSSGGEGIAVALGASPIGVGTDNGGCLRLPAAFNGVYALVTTNNRISRIGINSARLVPRIAVKAAIGPIARSVDDLVLFMRAILCHYHFQLDYNVVPSPFNENLFAETKPLKIGYYTSFNDKNLLEPVTGVKRAINCALNILKKANHHVVEFQVPKPEEAFLLYWRALFFDGGLNIARMLKDEPLHKSIVGLYDLVKRPELFRRMYAGKVIKKYGTQIRPVMESSLGLKSGVDAAYLLKNINQYNKEFMLAMGNLDVIICPVFNSVIPSKDVPPPVTMCGICYTTLYNLLDFPAGVLPITKTSEDDLKEDARLAQEFLKKGDKMNARVHQDQTTTGLPIAIQVVAKPYREEIVLRVMQLLESELKDETKLSDYNEEIGEEEYVQENIIPYCQYLTSYLRTKRN